jgi:hypothetical protein
MKIRLSRCFRLLLTFLLVFSWLFSGWPPVWNNPRIPPRVQKVQAVNYLANPSFTGGSTGWTLTTSTYDSTYYQDSAGSAGTATVVGRNLAAVGSAEQTISTSIGVGSSVLLSLYWSKQCVAKNCAINTVQVDIAKPSAPTTWVTIWSDTSMPAFGSATAWAGPSSLDVSANFDETGQYLIRLYANLKNGNDAGAQALAWFDNVNLNVTQPNITVGATGTQTANMNVNSTNNYAGGAFTFVRDTGTANVTQIVVTDQGTVNANSNLSNLDLYYETAVSCSYEGNETPFGTAASFNGSEKATVTGTMAVGTSQVCVYAVLDVGSGASADQTIELEISNPSTEVTVSVGTVSPGTAVAIDGTTTLQAAAQVSISIISDGSVSFGYLGLGASANNFSDIETIQVDSGPANLEARSTGFTAPGNTWNLGVGNSTDQVKWEFSKDTSSWTTFAVAGNLYSLATSVGTGATTPLYLRLTMPTSTDSYDEHSVAVTVVASSP